MRVLAPEAAQLSLDAKDWRIVHALLHNPRQSLSDIAKGAGLSRQSVEYRIKKLQESGLIPGYRSIINIKKLGFASYHVFVNLHDPAHEDILRKRATDCTAVNAVITYDGIYGFEISIMARSASDYQQCYNDLVKGIEVVDDQPLIILETVKAEILPHKFLKKEAPEPTLSPAKKPIDYTPDAADLKLLKLLADDASLSKTKLGKTVGLSGDAVAYRMKKLQDSKYLLEYRPVINYNILGLSIHCVLLKINHKSELYKEFDVFQRGTDMIIWSAKTFGSFDYIIYVLTKDLGEFHDLFRDIKTRFGDTIIKYELLYAHTQYKYTFMADAVAEKKI